MNTALYLHIPFCHRRCIYCDFYLTTNLKQTGKFTDALLKEIKLVSEKFVHVNISSIFFGGGTPSVLSIEEFDKIFGVLNKYFKINSDAEINIECNPEDIMDKFGYELKTLGFNRISAGVQSFIDSELAFLTRIHKGEEAIRAVDILKKSFDNISLDLIYGLPGQTIDDIKYNLDKFISLDIPHLSAYTLTYEEGTLLNKKYSGLKLSNNAEGEFYEYIYEFMNEKNYRHYEISNFARAGFESRHNLAYWKFKPYIGLGPSAHSFIEGSRYINKSSLTEYIKDLECDVLPVKFYETPDMKTKITDYLLCVLRSEGVELEYYKREFGRDFLEENSAIINLLEKNGSAVVSENHFKLTSKGFKIADEVILSIKS